MFNLGKIQKLNVLSCVTIIILILFYARLVVASGGLFGHIVDRANKTCGIKPTKAERQMQISATRYMIIGGQKNYDDFENRFMQNVTGEVNSSSRHRSSGSHRSSSSGLGNRTGYRGKKTQTDMTRFIRKARDVAIDEYEKTINQELASLRNLEQGKIKVTGVGTVRSPLIELATKNMVRQRRRELLEAKKKHREEIRLAKQKKQQIKERADKLERNTMAALQEKNDRIKREQERIAREKEQYQMAKLRKEAKNYTISKKKQVKIQIMKDATTARSTLFSRVSNRLVNN